MSELNKSKEDMSELNDAFENWKHEKLEEEISKIFKDDDNNDSFWKYFQNKIFFFLKLTLIKFREFIVNYDIS